MHAHARVHACAHRSSTASQGCASGHYMCECVCCYYFANPSTVSVCLSVHVRPSVLMLAYTILRSSPCSTNIRCWVNQLSYPLTHAYTYSHYIQHCHASTRLCKQPRETHTLTEARKARQKRRVAGPTTGCWTNEAPCIEEKQRVRQPAVSYTCKDTQSMCVGVYHCMRSESESELGNQLSGKQTNKHPYLCVCVCICV